MKLFFEIHKSLLLLIQFHKGATKQNSETLRFIQNSYRIGTVVYTGCICGFMWLWWSYPTPSSILAHRSEQGATEGELSITDSADGKDGKFWVLVSIVISSLLA